LNIFPVYYELFHGTSERTGIVNIGFMMAEKTGEPRDKP